MQAPVYEVLPLSAVRGDVLQHLALVTHPANGQGFLHAQPEQWQSIPARYARDQAETHTIHGVLLVPGQAILRYDEAGQPYYLVFTAEAIASVYDWLSDTNLPLSDNHQQPLPGTVRRLWLTTPEDRAGGAVDSPEPLPTGTLCCTVHLDQPAYWQLPVTERGYTGLSLAGQFSVRPGGYLHYDTSLSTLLSMKNAHALPEALTLMQRAWQQVMQALRPERQPVTLSQVSPPVDAPASEPTTDEAWALPTLTDEQIAAELAPIEGSDTRDALRQQVTEQTNRLQDQMLLQLSELYVSKTENEQLRAQLASLEQRLLDLGQTLDTTLNQAAPVGPLAQGSPAQVPASRASHVLQDMRRLNLL